MYCHPPQKHGQKGHHGDLGKKKRGMKIKPINHMAKRTQLIIIIAQWDKNRQKT